MSIITGQFSYEIENNNSHIVSFYLGKNDGTIYLKDFDIMNEQYKSEMYWIPTEFRFKLVNNINFQELTTQPVYPFPTTFNNLIPTTTQCWLYHNQFSIQNMIEYIIIYEVEEPVDQNITNNYSFFSIDSTNTLVEYSYDIPTIKNRKIEISIKDGGKLYGTWTSIIETYDIVKFQHIAGYDYRYKNRIMNYYNIINNINTLKNDLETTKVNINSINKHLINMNEIITNNYIINNFSNANINDGAMLNFKTLDGIAPILLYTIPSNDEEKVSINTNIILVFNENVQSGLGNVVITDMNYHNVIDTISITSTNVTFNNNIVTINPTIDLDYDTQYTIDISDIAIQDLTGNTCMINESIIDFNTSSSDDLVIISTTPITNLTDILVNSNIVLTFNNPVFSSIGNVLLKNISGIIIPNVITYNNSTITIQPTSDLDGLTEYYLEIQDNAIKDINNIHYSGTSDINSISFITIDTNKPQLMSSIPVNNDINVNRDNSIILTFDKQIIKGYETEPILLKNSTNVIVETIITFYGENIVIKPTSPLAIKETYTVNIVSNSVKNINNGLLNDEIIITFTTLDNEIPELISSVPTSGQLKVNINSDIELFFNENVKVGIGNILIYKRINELDFTDDILIETIAITNTQNVVLTGTTIGSNTFDSNKITINVSTFDNHSEYYILIDNDAIKDLANNNVFYGFKYGEVYHELRIDFTTIDSDGPELISRYPSNNSLNVYKDTKLKLRFDEKIQPGSNSAITIKKVLNDELVETVTPISFDENRLITNNLQDLDPSTEYYVNIETDVIQDLNGNSYNGISNTTDFRFKTEDANKPVIDYSSHQDAINILNISTIEINFNIDVKANAGNIYIKKSDDDTIVETYDITDGLNVYIPNNIVSFTTPSLESNTSYYIEIGDGVICNTDQYNQTIFAGITSKTDLQFTVVDTSPITYISYPSNDSDNISTNTNIVLIFNKNINITSQSLLLTSIYNDDIIIQSSQITIYKNIMTLNLNSQLESDTEYTLTIPENIIYYINTLQNNIYLETESSFSFTTFDNTNPILISSTPIDNAEDILQSTNITLTFSKNIIQGDGNIQLKRDDGVIINTNINFTPNSPTITITPLIILDSSTIYYVYIESNAIKDTTSNENYFAGLLDGSTSGQIVTITDSVYNLIFSMISEISGIIQNDKLLNLYSTSSTQGDDIIYTIVTANDNIVSTQYTTYDVTPINIYADTLINGITGTNTYTELYNLIEYIINKNCISRYRIDNIYMNRANLYMNYMNNLLHLEIYTIDINRKTTGNWFMGCDHSNIELDVGLSSLTMKYNTNINLVNSMLVNIRNIYQIGELQCIIINQLIEHLQLYHDKTELINILNINDVNLAFFKENITDIIEEINSISTYAIFENVYIFNSSTTNNKISYKFVNSGGTMFNTSNDLTIVLPIIDATSLNLINIEILYNDIVTNKNTILSKWNTAIGLLQSRKSVFDSTKLIIDLRIRSIINFIEYTKNFLDE